MHTLASRLRHRAFWSARTIHAFRARTIATFADGPACVRWSSSDTKALSRRSSRRMNSTSFMTNPLKRVARVVQRASIGCGQPPGANIGKVERNGHCSAT